MKGLALRFAAVLVATLFAGAGTLVATAPARAYAPLAHSAKVETGPKCTKFITASRASAALGVAVKIPVAETVADLFSESSADEGSLCPFEPVHPNATYLADETVATVDVQPGVTIGQLQKFIRDERGEGGEFTGGTLTKPAGLGKYAYLVVREDKETEPTRFSTFVAVLKGHDVILTVSQELTTSAPLVALTVGVYKKL